MVANGMVVETSLRESFRVFDWKAVSFGTCQTLLERTSATNNWVLLRNESPCVKECSLSNKMERNGTQLRPPTGLLFY